MMEVRAVRCARLACSGLIAHACTHHRHKTPRKRKQGNRQLTDFPVFYWLFIKAADWSRTSDLRFTKASLCQLSYGGNEIGTRG